MESYDFPYLGKNGMSSSQLTNSMIFQRGRYTTNQLCVGEVVILITTHLYNIYTYIYIN